MMGTIDDGTQVSEQLSEQVSGRGATARAWLPAAGSVLVLGAAIFVLWQFLFFRPGGPFPMVDLDYYRAAAAGVAAGVPLLPLLPYPPFAALVIAPLGGLSVATGNGLWTAASLLVLAGLSFLVVERAMTARGLDPRTDRPGLVARSCLSVCAVLLTVPVVSQLSLGQLSLFINALAIVDVARVLPRRWQGALVGLAGAIKVTPLIFIPYYLVTGQRRQAAVAAGSFGFFTAIGFACFPSDSVAFWSSLGATAGFGDPARPDNLSIKGFFYRWLPALAPVSAVWLGVTALVAVAALWRARQHFRRGETFASGLVVGCCAAALSPVSWPHYHVWLPLTAVWLVLGSGRRFTQLVGLATYVCYFAFNVPTPTASNLSFSLDVMVLVPVLIACLGLPHLPDRPAEAFPRPEMVPG